MDSFRLAPANDQEWIEASINKGFSNFQLVDDRFEASNILKRIFSIARKLGYQSLLIETIREEDCQLLKLENEHLHRRTKKFLGAEAKRISFFAGVPEDPGELFGYVIFKEDRFQSDQNPERGHVYESVMKPCRLEAENNFVHSSQSYEVKSGDKTRVVTGVIFGQQNDLTFVCAHVALRTVLASVLPEGDVSYPEINSILGIDHKKTRVGHGPGLTPDHMEKVLTYFKIPFTKIVHEPQQNELQLPGDFQRDLYGIIESGCPALLGFELKGNNSGRHIIPIIGHTFNEDTWVADSERGYFKSDLSYFSSENWLSNYVVHDDNFGPYFCIPRHYLKKDNFRIILGINRQQIIAQAPDIEATALTYAKAFQDLKRPEESGWFKRFRVYAKENRLVLRTLHLRRDEYVRHIRGTKSRDEHSHSNEVISTAETQLPETFWMVELSAPELFSSTRHKFGEVLLRSDLTIPSPIDFTLLLGLRLPDQFILHKGNSFNVIPSGILSHVPLFSFSDIK